MTVRESNRITITQEDMHWSIRFINEGTNVFVELIWQDKDKATHQFILSRNEWDQITKRMEAFSV